MSEKNQSYHGSQIIDHYHCGTFVFENQTKFLFHEYNL